MDRLSHLFFADDLVLFAKVDHINCSAIRDVLDDFVVYQANLLAKPSQEFSFLLMWIEILERPFVIYLVLRQPQCLVSILGFPSSMGALPPKTIISFWIG